MQYLILRHTRTEKRNIKTLRTKRLKKYNKLAGKYKLK